MRQEYADLQWKCSSCGKINRPLLVHCKDCGKQRWEQLGIGRAEAQELAITIHDEGLKKDVLAAAASV